MDRAHWRSPSFRGRSPHPRQFTPGGYRGGGGGYSHFSTPPQWQQRNPSPYHYQSGSQQSPGSGPYVRYTHHRHAHHPYATSTPVHGSGGRRPYFRGGGGPRFNKRQSFGDQSTGKGGAEDIESWVSPEMWADPWRYLTAPASRQQPDSRTKFAESDLNLTETPNTGGVAESNNSSPPATSKTKLAESDVTGAGDLNESAATNHDVGKNVTESKKLDENEIDLGDSDEDDDGKSDAALDEEQLLS